MTIHELTGGVPLARRALIGVRDSAQRGDLPLFAWTLGLSQAQLQALHRFCWPQESQALLIAESTYLRFVCNPPVGFMPLVALLRDAAPTHAMAPLHDWLARALAIACHGERRLWYELGLDSVRQLHALLQAFFPGLALGELSCRLDHRQYLLDCLARSLDGAGQGRSVTTASGNARGPV